MATEIVSLPVLGTLTAAEFHVLVATFSVFFLLAVSPLRTALRTEIWYAIGGIFSGTVGGFAVAAAVGWL